MLMSVTMHVHHQSSVREQFNMQESDPSLLSVSNLSSSGSSSESSSSDSQPGTGTTSQSDLPSSHDGGISSTGGPAARSSNGFVQCIRHILPNRNCSVKHIGKNPICNEEPGLNEVVPHSPTEIIPDGIPHIHIENNSVTSGLSENVVGADCSDDPKDGDACSCKRCLSVCIPISLVLVFCAGVALLVTFWPPYFQRHFLTEANVQMRVSDEFQPSMVNVSSPESVEYGNVFCHHLTQTIIKGMEVEAVDNCTVKNLRNGSIIVDAQVNVWTNQNLTADDFLHALQKAGRADGGYIMFGLIKVFNNSLNVSSVHTVEQPGDVPVRKVPAEFDCSVGGAHFKPFPYTYPGYCGHFQLCKDGEGIPLLCEVGLEFADDFGTTHTLCRNKSSTTYCGRNRSEDATSSTPSTTAATTSSSTTTTATDSAKSTNATPTVTAEATTTLHPRISTTSSSTTTTATDSTKSTNATPTVTAEATTTLHPRISATTSSSTTTTATDSTKSTNATPTVTAEATTTDICSSIPQSILSNDPSLYTCTDAWTFQPRNDTYPNNCGHFLECWNGVGIPRKCANGTHFAYGIKPRMACHNTYDDATFCRQMRLAQTC